MPSKKEQKAKMMYDIIDVKLLPNRKERRMKKRYRVRNKSILTHPLMARLLKIRSEIEAQEKEENKIVRV